MAQTRPPRLSGSQPAGLMPRRPSCLFRAVGDTQFFFFFLHDKKTMPGRRGWALALAATLAAGMIGWMDLLAFACLLLAFARCASHPTDFTFATSTSAATFVVTTLGVGNKSVVTAAWFLQRTALRQSGGDMQRQITSIQGAQRKVAALRRANRSLRDKLRRLVPLKPCRVPLQATSMRHCTRSANASSLSRARNSKRRQPCTCCQTHHPHHQLDHMGSCTQPR